MSEIVGKVLRRGSLALALILGGTACATTSGNGFLAPSGKCIEYDATVSLPDNIPVRIAARDLSVGIHHWEDTLQATNLGGIKVRLHKSGNEKSNITLDGNVAETYRNSSDVNVNVQGSSLEEAHPVTYTEGVKTIELRFAEANDNVIRMSIHQVCAIQ